MTTPTPLCLRRVGHRLAKPMIMVKRGAHFVADVGSKLGLKPPRLFGHAARFDEGIVSSFDADVSLFQRLEGAGQRQPLVAQLVHQQLGPAVAGVQPLQAS